MSACRKISEPTDNCQMSPRPRSAGRVDLKCPVQPTHPRHRFNHVISTPLPQCYYINVSDVPPIPVSVRTYRPEDLSVCRQLYREGLIGGQLAENDTGLDIDDI